jgi:hypothetical protein
MPYVAFSHALKFTNLINPYALNALLLISLIQADDLCVREVLVSPCQYLQRTRLSDALLLALNPYPQVTKSTPTPNASLKSCEVSVGHATKTLCGSGRSSSAVTSSQRSEDGMLQKESGQGMLQVLRLYRSRPPYPPLPVPSSSSDVTPVTPVTR